MPEINNKNGRVSAYGFLCGYIETHERGKVRVTLWHETPMFHVRCHDHGNYKRIFWETFEKLLDARKHYNKTRRVINAAQICQKCGILILDPDEATNSGVCEGCLGNQRLIMV